MKSALNAQVYHVYRVGQNLCHPFSLYWC